jgi:UDP-GlcNAc:undecaprenyl-phosphate GlcNAc-1-phosphate transferase
MLWQLQYWPRTWIVAGCTAFVLAAVIMPVAIFLLRRFGVYDQLADNKLHKKPIVRGGGVVIFLAFAIAVILPDYRSYPMIGVMIGSFVCMVVGALDDVLGGIPAAFKFLTLILVTGVLYQYDVKLQLFSWEWLNFLCTLLWIVGVTSAFNGTDNMDGLASGTALIISTMFLIIAVQSFYAAGTETALSWFGLLSAGLIGANLGFLIYNSKPAHIFMGDAGSFFLGFTLSALGVMGQWNENPVIAWTIPVLIMAVPIFDFAYILLARIYWGETRTIHSVISHCAMDHLSHRLTWMGFSQRQTVFIIYMISVALGVTGVLLRNSTNWIDSALGLLQGGVILLLVASLMFAANRRHQRDLAETAKE